jgi:hypothetical protein
VPDSTLLSYVEARVLELHTNGTANCLPAMEKFPDLSPSTLGCINGEALQRNRRLSKCLCKGSSNTNGEGSGELVSERLAPDPITWHLYASHARMDHRLNHPLHIYCGSSVWARASKVFYLFDDPCLAMCTTSPPPPPPPPPGR